MKLHLSVPSHALLLLATIFIGCSTGVLWPMNGFLLKFIVGFTETLFAILIIASVVWCASTLYIFACRPFLRLFKFQKKITYVRPSATHDEVKSITAASTPRRDEVTAGRWIGVAVLTGVAALWSLLLGWTLSTVENSFIVFSGWSAVGCAAAGFGLSVIAGAFDSDDVGTLGFLVLMAGIIFTMLVLAALFASIA